MKRSSKTQRRKNKDYWDRKKRSKAQEEHIPERDSLVQTSPTPTQGLRLPSAQGKLLLTEAADGTLIDVPEEKLGDWAELQGQGAEPQGLTEREGMLLDKVLEMLYGGADGKQ